MYAHVYRIITRTYFISQSTLSCACDHSRLEFSMDLIYFFAAFGVISTAIYFYLTFWYGYWENYGLPVPYGTLPGLGNMYPVLFLKKNLAHLAKDIYEQTNGYSMAGFYDYRKPSLIVRDPELVKSVMQGDFSHFHQNESRVDAELDPLIYTNPSFSFGTQWNTSRKQLSSALTPGKMKNMYQSIDGVCAKLVDYLNQKIAEAKDSDGFEVEGKELFSRFTAEVVAVAAYGVNGDSFNGVRNGIFREMGKLMFEPSRSKGLKQLVGFTIPFLRKLLRISFMPFELMMRYQESGQTDAGSGEKFDDMSIVSHTTAFFLDGYESTSIAISFFAHLLARHPDVQQKIRNEIFTAVKKHDGITYDALQEMVYLEQAFNESLRLFPVLGVLNKVCTKEIHLKGSDGLNCRITPGTTVRIPVFGLHMDPKYWQNPDQFQPERFSEINKQNTHKYVYLPFGEGPRICVGMRIGILQAKAAIATTLKHFTLEFSTRTKLPVELSPNYFLTSAAGGLWMKIKPISNG
ncbi:cytochrome P450 9e2-like isoform X1 [Athalia rosae]|uniref:cytochrome P450 9e2-like isoform X1 n=1 Tax=Athalia rosae TaxID=37344 RepID=UPI00203492F1|nr:cytochrome P450 9e2-like isoform X1 [Athalia rosae]